MKIYIFVEINGNATIVISADSEDDAIDYLNYIVLDKDNWRLDEERDEEDDW